MSNFNFTQCLEKLVDKLATLPAGEVLAEALATEKDFITLLQHQKVKGITDIRTIEGQAPQDIIGEPVNTNFHEYVDNIIRAQIASGEISDGKQSQYDDRKVRWSGAGVRGNWFCRNEVLYLEVGPTTYPRYRQDIERTKIESLELMLKGLEKYNDPFVYFARTMGVTVIPISRQGSVYIGERSPNIDCPGLLNFVAGLATFNEIQANINFYADAQRELAEEVGISMELNNSNTQFIGIAGNPFTSENDLVFIVETSVDETHFESQGLSEHSRLVRLNNKSDAEILLYEGLLPGEKTKKAIAYASRIGLEYLVKHIF
ncbi:NUDIX hydrolase [Nostoc sp.]|uniref:NUDIX hydrolase n=1 Tax=Nostoc sp. TaxID=1180 RepID=UPI002FF4E68B